MVFVEHRGAGKGSSADVSRMEARWDLEWQDAGAADAVASLAQSENWERIHSLFPSGSRILEAGCGYARWVRFLANEGHDAYGVDFSPVAIRVSLRDWPSLIGKVLQADLRRLPFADGFFDGIVSFGAIEHDIDGPDAALSEMRRVLRPGGAMYCTVPCFNGLRRIGLLALQDWIVCNRTIRRLTGRRPEFSFFEYVWSRAEYEQILRRNGFEIIEMVPLLPPAHWMGKQGTVRWRLVEGLHRRRPWLMPHMMAAVCRRP
jgi:SAM-dependent methyltransferase